MKKVVKGDGQTPTVGQDTGLARALALALQDSIRREVLFCFCDCYTGQVTDPFNLREIHTGVGLLVRSQIWPKKKIGLPVPKKHIQQ